MTVTQRLEDDAARLAELGYESEFSREVSLRASFALGFTSQYPIAGGVYPWARRRGVAAGRG